MILTSEAKTPSAARDDIVRLLDIRKTSFSARLHWTKGVKDRLQIKAAIDEIDDIRSQLDSIIFPNG